MPGGQVHSNFQSLICHIRQLPAGSPPQKQKTFLKESGKNNSVIFFIAHQIKIHPVCATTVWAR